MTPVVRHFIAYCAEHLPLRPPVVELGSRWDDAQGSEADLRDLVRLPYWGIDQRLGRGVDVLMDMSRLGFRDESIGTLLCVETLEHVRNPLTAVEEMYRVLRSPGVLLATSVMIFPVHAPPDYWRFTPEGFHALFEHFESVVVDCQGSPEMPEHVFAVAAKGFQVQR